VAFPMCRSHKAEKSKLRCCITLEGSVRGKFFAFPHTKLAFFRH
jgi:hypothetical protein